MNEDTSGSGGFAELHGEPVRQRVSGPIGLLYAFELELLTRDYRKIATPYAGQSDAWWVAIDGEASEPVTFRNALRVLMDGTQEITILHESHGEDEAAPWTTIRYSPYWSRPSVAITWIVGFFAVCASLGWALIASITPRAFQGPAEIAYWVAVVLVTLHCAFPKQSSIVMRRLGALFQKRSSNCASNSSVPLILSAERTPE